ncbi:hypothetical protein HU200_052980 [Digitaria exilis]|uniref:Uncharacterized protein n=1 Tax=Digitaria exilis TaxID=1010633 RepID=A0A835E3Q2_9POAL|nr:hypothetical protein HU200_052980 [Digitaria exilis]
MGAWLLWKHRNFCVFEGVNPCMDDLLRAIKDEEHLWCMVGARRLASLSVGQAEVAG